MSKIDASTSKKVAQLKAAEKKQVNQVKAEQAQVDAIFDTVEQAAPVAKAQLEQVKGLVDQKYSVERAAI